VVGPLGSLRSAGQVNPLPGASPVLVAVMSCEKSESPLFRSPRLVRPCEKRQISEERVGPEGPFLAFLAFLAEADFQSSGGHKGGPPPLG
jgi:hypothetical protein